MIIGIARAGNNPRLFYLPDSVLLFFITESPAGGQSEQGIGSGPPLNSAGFIQMNYSLL
jgi:hypothetical protein